MCRLPFDLVHSSGRKRRFNRSFFGGIFYSESGSTAHMVGVVQSCSSRAPPACFHTSPPCAGCFHLDAEQARLPSAPHLPLKMSSYLICIRNGSSVIGRAPVLLRVLPYSNSPHPSLLPCLSGIPLLSSTSLPPPSPFFQHTRRSASSTWLHPPYPQCTAVAACQGCGGAVSGGWGWGVGGGRLL